MTTRAQINLHGRDLLDFDIYLSNGRDRGGREREARVGDFKASFHATCLLRSIEDL